MTSELVPEHDESEDQAAARESREFAAISSEDAIRRVMGTREGRSVLWTILTDLGMFQPIATGDAMQLMRAAALRDAGLDLYLDLDRLCPDQLAQAKKESDD